jgi:cyclopropane-fatty-acyl-phospholipid synthase
MYTTGVWAGRSSSEGLDAATDAKIDRTATLLGAPVDRVLDLGCGWGHALSRLTAHFGATGIGLTLSPAQHAHASAQLPPGVEVRLESWEEHEPSAAYDGIVSFGMFEHVASDGQAAPARVARYRRFFERCHRWLRPDGRLVLETIAYDDAPDTAAPLGRGPLGDAVLTVFPESSCPHLAELVLGFEPWFEVHHLEQTASDYALTCRAWRRRLRDRRTRAVEVVGEEVVRTYERYLAASEVQFRLRTITNYRLALQRRPEVKF